MLITSFNRDWFLLTALIIISSSESRSSSFWTTCKLLFFSKNCNFVSGFSNKSKQMEFLWFLKKIYLFFWTSIIWSRFVFFICLWVLNFLCVLMPWLTMLATFWSWLESQREFLRFIFFFNIVLFCFQSWPSIWLCLFWKNILDFIYNWDFDFFIFLTSLFLLIQMIINSKTIIK